MTFIEAAVALLTELGKSTPVEALCDLAIERDMLSKPGKTPLRSMKAALTRELKKGEESRVASEEKDVWFLAGAEPEPEADELEADELEADELEADELEADTATDTDHAPAIPADLPPEERAIAEAYADDLSPAGPAAANKEYRDQLTDDEDRPMRPEILPKRDRFRGRKDRRERMKERREERKRRRKERQDKRGDKPAAASAVVPTSTIANPYVAGAVKVLAARNERKPMAARQIADAMKSRGLIDGAPPKSGLAIKAALMHDSQLRRARGLRPRVVYKGNDEFTLAGTDISGALATAEADVESAIRTLESATRAAFADRIAGLRLGALERLATVYLHATGWTGVEWLKRVDKSAYATGTPAGESEPWLIGVRIGPEPVDRRGVGELRAGVVAKQLAAALLLSPVELSAEAESELARDGAPTSVVCGSAFSAALVGCGVGVSVSAAPVLYLDTDFFSEISDE